METILAYLETLHHNVLGVYNTLVQNSDMLLHNLMYQYQVLLTVLIVVGAVVAVGLIVAVRTLVLVGRLSAHKCGAPQEWQDVMDTYRQSLSEVDKATADGLAFFEYICNGAKRSRTKPLKRPDSDSPLGGRTPRADF